MIRLRENISCSGACAWTQEEMRVICEKFYLYVYLFSLLKGYASNQMQYSWEQHGVKSFVIANESIVLAYIGNNLFFLSTRNNRHNRTKHWTLALRYCFGTNIFVDTMCVFLFVPVSQMFSHFRNLLSLSLEYSWVNSFCKIVFCILGSLKLWTVRKTLMTF